ncbi:MAG TPA: hypothetical protein H9796_07590 [Candidatus Butyricimonas faecavium]|nr:hypothetical protein [Candidatus Butyricimonas faecavium]
MKTKWNQMVIVVLLLVIITSIVVYMWIGFAELIHFFDCAAGEALTGMNVRGL